MTSILTLEDVNSVNVNHINEIYVLDTSKISSQEFTSVLYDFCIVSHSISGSNHTFTFEVKNTLWTGGYYLTKNNGTYINSNASYSSNVITFTTTETSVKLHLYLCNFASSFNFSRLSYRFDTSETGIYLLDNKEITTSKSINLVNISSSQQSQTSVTFNGPGVYTLGSGYGDLYVLVSLKKSDVIFDLSETSVTVGEVNKVQLNVDTKYLPGGEMVNDEVLNLIVKYNNIEIPVTYDEDLNDYTFDLDLADKLTDSNVRLQVICKEIDVVNSNVFDCTLECHYSSVDNFSSLQSAIVNGSRIIELSGDITFTTNLTLLQDLYIIGNDYALIMNGNSIIVPVNMGLKLSECTVNSGNPAIIQKRNSNVVLINSNFTNCSISDTSKGSAISSTGNATAEITNCKFINCHHTIYFAGDILINNCEALFNTWNESVDTDYSAFLTLYEGTCNINYSIFDIDYDIDTLCTNETDIKFAQSLISLAEDTTFNGNNSNLLSANDCLPFFNGPYNNRSHVYCKYYYPQIEACVIASPKLNYEDRSVMHSILGSDWIFKNNVQLTRANANTQNEVRRITWE